MKLNLLYIFLLISFLLSCEKGESTDYQTDSVVEYTKSTLGELPSEWTTFLAQEHEEDWHHRKIWTVKVDIDKSLENGYPSFSDQRRGILFIDYFDQEGNKISSHEFSDRLKKDSSTQNTYTEDGLPLSSIRTYDYDADDDTIFFNTYNENGLLIKKVNYGREILYEYDKEGNLILQNSDQEPTEHVYDQNNRRIKSTQFNADSSIYKTINISYDGEIRKEENLINGRLLSIYYFEGDQLLKDFSFTTDTEITYRIFSDYDEKLRPSSIVRCSKSLEKALTIPETLIPCENEETYKYEQIDSLGFKYDLTHSNFKKNIDVRVERIEKNPNFAK